MALSRSPRREIVGGDTNNNRSLYWTHAFSDREVKKEWAYDYGINKASHLFDTLRAIGRGIHHLVRRRSAFDRHVAAFLLTLADR